jgi:hypothetical protein
VARKQAYERVGGHAKIRASRHDGITLPRAFRAAGARTDLFDATAVASCRMYRGGRDLWSGFAKNATEGMASPAGILPWTVLLFGGQILPFVLLGLALAGALPAVATAIAATAVGLCYAGRMLMARRFRQSTIGALLHPVGVTLVLAIQWFAWWRARVGRGVEWKGRLEVEG